MNSKTLATYLELIRSSNPLEDASFQKVLQQSELFLTLSDGDLAGLLQLSRTTINRWRTGKNAPMPLMRKSIFSILEKRTRRQLKLVQAAEGGGDRNSPPIPVAARGRS